MGGNGSKRTFNHRVVQMFIGSRSNIFSAYVLHCSGSSRSGGCDDSPRVRNDSAALERSPAFPPQRTFPILIVRQRAVRRKLHVRLLQLTVLQRRAKRTWARSCRAQRRVKRGLQQVVNVVGQSFGR
jgi:hypothetical protein